MEEYESIELRSEEIQEILGTPPRKIVRWGTTITFLTFCLLLFVSYFVRYPDVIQAPIILTTANPPVEMSSPVDASIVLLYVSNGQPVVKGDILAQLDGLANYNDVFYLEEQLKEELSTVNKSSLLSFVPQTDLQLGLIQPVYTRFLKNYETYRFGVSSNYAQQNIISLNNQITSLQNAINANNNRKPDLEKALKTAEVTVDNLKKRYTSDPSLLSQLQNAANLLKNLKTEMKDLEAENARNLVEISNLQTQIKASQAQSGTTNSNSLLTIRSDLSDLLGEIERWKKDNILVAPKDGIAVLDDKIREKQAIQKGQKILSVVPQGQEYFFGKVSLPIKGSGKVEVGQEVVIKFDNFPYQEYGMVNGIVERKSILPDDKIQNIYVSLDNTLITSHKKELPYTPFMSGTAEIITKDRRFIERVFENITAFSADH